MIRAMVVGMSVQSSAYPNFAPACEYVKIPPGSLSTLAVMNPGPKTAKNASRRNLSTLIRLRLCGFLGRRIAGNSSVRLSLFISHLYRQRESEEATVSLVSLQSFCCLRLVRPQPLEICLKRLYRQD